MTNALATIDDVKLIAIRSSLDPNGNLGFIEANRDIPFEIARMFYVYGVHAGDLRGEHSHRACQQFLICVNGRVEVECDDGKSRRKFCLDNPLTGLLVPATIWAEQRYASSETMLFVVTDQLFTEEDYIRDYGSFLAFRGVPARQTLP